MEKDLSRDPGFSPTLGPRHEHQRPTRKETDAAATLV
jgi:hypothetical protein